MLVSIKFKTIIFSLIFLLLLVVGQVALAQDPVNPSGVNSALNGLNNTANVGGIQTSQTDLPIIIGRVVGAALALVGAIFFMLILWAGFGWMLAKGNEEEITKAKETIIGAFLGLIVILGAYAITNLAAKIFSTALTG